MAGISTGPMADKTVLVTGGTGGIGKATAVRVQAGPRRRWHVYGLAASPAGWGAEPASGVSSRYLIS